MLKLYGLCKFITETEAIDYCQKFAKSKWNGLADKLFYRKNRC